MGIRDMRKTQLSSSKQINISVHQDSSNSQVLGEIHRNHKSHFTRQKLRLSSSSPIAEAIGFTPFGSGGDGGGRLMRTLDKSYSLMAHNVSSVSSSAPNGLSIQQIHFRAPANLRALLRSL